MKITERNGILIEATDPRFVSGIHHAWITDKREGSPDCGLIVGHGQGKTPGEAAENALKDWTNRDRPVSSNPTPTEAERIPPIVLQTMLLRRNFAERNTSDSYWYRLHRSYAKQALSELRYLTNRPRKNLGYSRPNKHCLIGR